MALDTSLGETGTVMCFQCRAPLGVEDQQSTDYVAEKHCPYCVRGKDDFRGGDKQEPETKAGMETGKETGGRNETEKGVVTGK